MTKFVLLVSFVSQYMHTPKIAHLEVVHLFLWYINSLPHKGIPLAAMDKISLYVRIC